MEELMGKMAETLGMTVEGLVETYPEIRNQFIRYEVISGVREVIAYIVVILFISLLVWLFTEMWVYLGMTVGKEDIVKEQYKDDVIVKMYTWYQIHTKKLFVALFLAIVMITVINVLKVIFAPDYTILLKIIESTS